VSESTPAGSLAPPGWYPDPAGDPGWRRFDGTTWTADTIAYSEARELASGHEQAIAATRHLAQVGVVAWFAGAALAVCTYVHRDAFRAAGTSGLFVALLVVGLASLLVGSLAYTRAAAALGSLDALGYVPVLNTVIWIWRAAEGAPAPLAFAGHVTSRGLANALAAFQSVIACLLVFDAFAPPTRALVATFVVAGEASLAALVNLIVAREVLDEIAA